jgi:DNA repair protein RecO (recombination protein O)
MANYQITGIVIGRTNFGEADRVIRVLTAERGKIGLMARGVRKIKSRSAGHLEPYGEVALSLAEGRGSLDVVTGARLVWYPHRLRDDYPALELTMRLTTLVDRVAAERQPAPELFHHLRETLGAIDADGATALVEAWFKLRLLQISGFRPALNNCLICGSSDPGITYHFDAARGGLVCDSCGANINPMTLEAIKLWRLMSDYHYPTIHKITGAETIAAATNRYIDEFIVQHLGFSAR